jgi:hypothetical protein
MSVLIEQRRLRGKCAPGIKRCVLAEMRRVLVEFDECNTAEAWGALADVSTTTAGKYLRFMAARGAAERAGLRELVREATHVYMLVYRARGYVGPYPLPTLRSPGLIDWSAIPVVGR